MANWQIEENKRDPEFMLFRYLKQMKTKTANWLHDHQNDSLVDLSYYKALKPEYFNDHNGFLRCQDIPEKYFASVDSDTYFISHRWETPEHPDPNGNQYSKIPKNHKIWYDYSCMPQSPRSLKEEDSFKKQLHNLNDMIARVRTFTIQSDDYFQRSWCIAEYQFVSYDMSRLPDNIKMKYISILAVFCLGLEYPNKATVINKAINQVLSKTKLTNGKDREIVEQMMRSQFENPTRNTVLKLNSIAMTLNDNAMKVRDALIDSGFLNEAAEMALEYFKRTGQMDMIYRNPDALTISQMIDKFA